MHIAPNGREGREYNAEEVYQMLLNKADKNDGDYFSASLSGNHSVQVIDRHDVWKAISNESSLRDTWNERIRKAVSDCRGIMQIPPSIRKIAEELQKRSKIDWKQMLHDFLQYDGYDYSFTPPDRRFSSGEYYLPAYNIDEDCCSVRDIWICMDTSASVSDKELRDAMNEVQDAMRQAGLTGSISFFDGSITEPVPFTSQQELAEITPVGGGGTSYYPIFRHLPEWFYADLPKAILIFTDGYVNSWPKEEQAMDVPVIWLISKGGNTRIPWGKVVELR